MERFTALVMRARNYYGEVCEASIQEDRDEIFALTAKSPDLVDSFLEAVDSYPEWRELAQNDICYYINRIKYMKSRNARQTMQPSIKPMIWGDVSGQVAVIKVTL